MTYLQIQIKALFLYLYYIKHNKYIYTAQTLIKGNTSGGIL